MAGKHALPPDCAVRIKALRTRLDLSQTRLANLLGVSCASVNRWENEQSRPSMLAWQQIAKAEEKGFPAPGPASGGENHTVREKSAGYDAGPPALDFAGRAEAVRSAAEGE